MLADVVTRWFSTIRMLRRVTEERASISVVYIANDRAGELPLEDDWTLAVWIVQILGPFESACADFEPSHSVTISEVGIVQVMRVGCSPAHAVSKQTG